MSKNKLKKFAEMETFNNVFQCGMQDLESSEVKAMAGHWRENYFKNNNPIVLELGCGRGEYTVGLAQKNPNKNYIGIDIKGARMWRGAKTATERGMENVGFLRTRIEFIRSFFAEGEAVKSAAAMRIRQGFDITVVGGKATNMHSLLQAIGCAGVSIDGVTIEGGKNGISFGTSTDLTLTNSNITTDGYGVRADGTTATLEVSATSITAAQPVIVRKLTAGEYKLAIGENVTLDTKTDYQIVFTNGSDDAEYVTPNGKFTLTGLKKDDVIQVSFVGFQTRSVIVKDESPLTILLNGLNGGQTPYDYQYRNHSALEIYLKIFANADGYHSKLVLHTVQILYILVHLKPKHHLY